MLRSTTVGRIAAGWHLAKLSLRVVRSDGALTALVILGGIASGAVALGFLVPAAVAYGIEEKWLAGVIAVIGVYLASAGLATFLVVPILALEGLGPLAALDRSASLFRQKWGEQLVGTASIGVLFALLGTVPALVLGFLGLASGSTAVAIVLIVLAVLIAVAAGVLGSAARAVFAVALYRYAVGVGATGPFSDVDLESAVARKR